LVRESGKASDEQDKLLENDGSFYFNEKDNLPERYFY